MTRCRRKAVCKLNVHLQCCLSSIIQIHFKEDQQLLWWTNKCFLLLVLGPSITFSKGGILSTCCYHASFNIIYIYSISVLLNGCICTSFLKRYILELCDVSVIHQVSPKLKCCLLYTASEPIMPWCLHMSTLW